eukprot:119433_1
MDPSNINGCEYNLVQCDQKECIDCKDKLNQCYGNSTICAFKSRDRNRFATLNNIDENISPIISHSTNETSFNHHVKHQRRIDGGFQHRLDSIHTELLHKTQYQRKSELMPASNPEPNLNNLSRLLNINPIKTSLTKPDVHTKVRDDNRNSVLIQLTEVNKDDIDDDEMKFLRIKNKGKYASNIASYKFGEDHRYEYLGPKQGHKCFKDNILMSGFVLPEVWDSKMSKSFSKLSIYQIVSKQYRADYCINRGDKMSVPHMMA